MGPIRFVPKRRLASDPPGMWDVPLGPSGEPVLDAPLPEASTTEALGQGLGSWTILIATFPSSASGEARQALERVHAAGLPEAELQPRGKALCIVAGTFRSGSDPEAQRDLRRVREMVVAGARPFEGALLAPPVFEGLAGTKPEWDLSTVRRRYGKDALYTLQVAVYEPKSEEPTSEEMRAVRMAAESAAGEFRKAGDDAYYYHGPRRSMVTIGVFGPKEYDVQNPGRESPRLTLFRQKYPYNLVNGATYKARVKGQASAREQPSFVVAIPE